MPDGRHYAILIGSSSFHPKSGLKELRCPERDVDGMAALLTSAEYGLFASEHIRTFKNQPHHEILPEINEVFHDAQADDLILLYYSGHGELDNKDHLHLATPDTRKTALETTSIPTERLRRLIDNYRCKRVVLILDCCYSGAIKNDLLKSSLDGQMNQLAKGIYILTASTELQTAEEKEGDEHSLLTKHILQGIRQGKVPSDANGTISISALQSYVSVAVPRDGAQQPSGYGLDERGGELIIARAAQPYDLRAFRLLISNLEAEQEIDDELADDLRQFIKHSQPKRDKALLDLLNELHAQKIKPGRFISQWHRLNKAFVVEEKPAPPKTSAPSVSPENKAMLTKLHTSVAPLPPTQRQASAPAKLDTIVAGTGFTDDLKGVKLEMIYVPGGQFMMGSELNDREKPLHLVTVPNFYIGKYLVTQAQWVSVMGNNPSFFMRTQFSDRSVLCEGCGVTLRAFMQKCPRCGWLRNGFGEHPVEQVTWEKAKQFCLKLGEVTQKAYRLPTEAEWEFACRAGTIGNYAGNLDEMGWYEKNSDSKTHPVGMKQANAFGLYDMHGNIWELCEDAWHGNYNGAPDDGSAWVKDGDQERPVLRGGSCVTEALYCRSAYRDHFHPDSTRYGLGLRVVVSARTQ